MFRVFLEMTRRITDRKGALQRTSLLYTNLFPLLLQRINWYFRSNMYFVKCKSYLLYVLWCSPTATPNNKHFRAWHIQICVFYIHVYIHMCACVYARACVCVCMRVFGDVAACRRAACVLCSVHSLTLHSTQHTQRSTCCHIT